MTASLAKPPRNIGDTLERRIKIKFCEILIAKDWSELSVKLVAQLLQLFRRHVDRLIAGNRELLLQECEKVAVLRVDIVPASLGPRGTPRYQRGCRR